MDLLLICPFLFTLMLSKGSLADLEKQRVDSGLEIYKKLFEVKRKDQMNALKNLIELNDVNQQYKIIDIMLKGLFKVLEDSRAVLIAADVPPDGPFPQDEKLKDAYSHVVENTAFFGDVVLRFPKIVHHYFDRNSNWNNLIRWGIGFCNLTGVFEQGPHSQVLGLVRPSLARRIPSPLPGGQSVGTGARVKGEQAEGAFASSRACRAGEGLPCLRDIFGLEGERRGPERREGSGSLRVDCVPSGSAPKKGRVPKGVSGP
nr:PREDICTED: coiled-coil domain-containing protein 134 [Struthio camelus australis]